MSNETTGDDPDPTLVQIAREAIGKTAEFTLPNGELIRQKIIGYDPKPSIKLARGVYLLLQNRQYIELTKVNEII
jgi:hypothetical protein